MRICYSPDESESFPLSIPSELERFNHCADHVARRTEPLRRYEDADTDTAVSSHDDALEPRVFIRRAAFERIVDLFLILTDCLARERVDVLVAPQLFESVVRADHIVEDLR